MLRRFILGGVIGFAAAMPLQASAQSLEVHPISVELARGRSTGTLTLSNHGTLPVTIQVRAFVWSQHAEGLDQLDATEAIILSPPFVTLQGGQSQIVRLLVRQPATDKEQSYRLLLDQIPSASGEAGVHLVLHFLVPIFVEPASTAPARLEWSLAIGSHGEGTLIAVNSGGRRVQLDHLSWLTDGMAPVNILSNGSAYVLSGAQRHWMISDIESHVHDGAVLHLNATMNGQASEVVVPVVRNP
jgi:fimbrial chaperone protein